MKKIFVVGAGLIGYFVTPAITFAAYVRGSYQFPAGQTLADVIFWVLDLMNLVVTSIVALGVIFFLWGVVKFIRDAGDPDARKEGRNFIIGGLIGLTIMLSFWALVSFVQRSFNLDSAIPQFNPGVIQDSSGTLQNPTPNPNIDYQTGQATV